MDYFCYISRTKVDQLYAQLDPQQRSEFTEQETIERSRSGGLNAGLSLGEIVTLFKGGMTYGRKDLVQRERKIKLAYVEKLRDVLLAIAADQGNIPDIDESIASNQLGSIYQYYRGSFRVDSPVLKPTTSDIVRLRSRIGRYTLLLDCSLRFFSEGPEPDGTFLLHSGNSSFFNGDIGLKLDSVFILLHREGRQFIGTPLFLRLSTDRPAGMLAL